MIADSWTWSDLIERPCLLWFLSGFQIWKDDGRPAHQGCGLCLALVQSFVSNEPRADLTLSLVLV